MVIIERAQRDNILQIIELDRRAFGDQGISKETIESQIEIFPEGIYIAKENNAIVGIVSCERHEKEKFPQYNHDLRKIHSKSGTMLYISVITVLEKFRNKNIGSLLLEKVLTFGKNLGIRKIYLPVNKRHPFLEKGVLRFWQKNSYEIIGETNWEIAAGKLVNVYVLEKLI
jgi:ribosomal protein S18 acetylase RimI-like enzyme